MAKAVIKCLLVTERQTILNATPQSKRSTQISAGNICGKTELERGMVELRILSARLLVVGWGGVGDIILTSAGGTRNVEFVLEASASVRVNQVGAHGEQGGPSERVEIIARPSEVVSCKGRVSCIQVIRLHLLAARLLAGANEGSVEILMYEHLVDDANDATVPGELNDPGDDAAPTKVRAVSLQRTGRGKLLACAVN